MKTRQSQRILRKQRFSLPNSIIKYIIGRANADVMRNLYQTCKYFYKISPYFIIDTLEVYHDTACFQSHTHIFSLNLHDYFRLVLVKNIWVKSVIKFYDLDDEYDIIEKIKKCDALEVLLPNVPINLKRLKVICKSSNLTKLRCPRVLINFIDKELVPLEDILNLIPNVTHLTINDCHVSRETDSKLFAMKRKVKFESLQLKSIDGNIDAKMFHRFIKNNAVPYAEVALRFKTINNKAFEKDFNAIMDNEDDDDEPVAKKSKLLNFYTSLTKTMTFNHQNMISQNFPLPKPIMAYIILKSNQKLVKKLYKTCKYFYFRNPYCIIDKIKFDERQSFFKLGKIKYLINDLEHLENYNNIWVTQFISIEENNEMALNLIPKIIRCNAQEIELAELTISKEEFNILTKFENIESWDSDECQIIDSTTNLQVPLEDLLRNLINAKDITIDNCHVTPETMNKLLAMPWKNQLSELCLTNVDGQINVELFYQFLEKSLKPKKAFVEVFFNFPEYQRFAIGFKAALKIKLEKWEPIKFKPRFLLTPFSDNDDDDSSSSSSSSSSSEEANSSEDSSDYEDLFGK